MLNKFKNVLYGSSSNKNENDNSIVITRPANSKQHHYEPGQRITAPLTRSSSFREDLIGDHNSFDGSTSAKHNTKQSKDDTHFTRRTAADSSSAPNSLFRSSNHNGNQSKSGGRSLYATSNNLQDHLDSNGRPIKALKFAYTRPEFLQLRTEDEIFVSADHHVRPIILPRDFTRLPWRAGYAECINAGKSLRNEDQACCYQDLAFKRPPVDTDSRPGQIIPSSNQIPWVYFGMFDGHAGAAVAVAAAAQLHQIIGDKLNHISDILIALEFGGVANFSPDLVEDSGDEYKDCEEKEQNTSRTLVNTVVNQVTNLSPPNSNGITKPNSVHEEQPDKENTNNEKPQGIFIPDSLSNIAAGNVKRNWQGVEELDETWPRNNTSFSNGNLDPPFDSMQYKIDLRYESINVDSLITGALESAFWEMDQIIAKDKQTFKMPGGCTAVVSLFILGKLYVCNAGDSRAIVYKKNEISPMSNDHTPTSERERILRLGQQRPEFMGTEFTHLEFVRRPTRKDVGKQMLYKDAFMTGWSMKTITPEDVKIPLVWGEGKRGRVLATIGVTRGFGDHELRTQYGSVLIKPFLTPEPEVKILALEDDEGLTAEDVLIMGTDGLWDVTSNNEAAEVVKNSFEVFPDSEESRSKYRYITAAQDLVIHSRGNTDNSSNIWRTNDERIASMDDITVFVIPLKQYRDEYIEWKRLHRKSLSKMSVNVNDVLYYS